MARRPGGDLRHAVRGVRRSPGFAASVVLMLALGLGANTAMFGIVYGVPLRPLPSPDAAAIVRIGESLGSVGGSDMWLSNRSMPLLERHEVGDHLDGLDRCGVGVGPAGELVQVAADARDLAGALALGGGPRAPAQGGVGNALHTVGRSWTERPARFSMPPTRCTGARAADSSFARRGWRPSGVVPESSAAPVEAVGPWTRHLQPAMEEHGCWRSCFTVVTRAESRSRT